MSRRDELLDRVTDYVLGHGLIGLTLRPLAAATGTSDRMLIYHFGSRDALVSAVVARSTERAIVEVEALPAAPSVRSAVNRLWAAYRTEPLNSCLDVYCQAAATGLIGQEPYRSDARAMNERWEVALRDYLVRSGAPPRRVARIVTLVDSALYGFHLDLATDRPEELARGIDDLGRAAEELAAPAGPPGGTADRHP
jgi:AcrR family transcriptional regulator